MSALLALVATVLTSFLPILNKRILQDARPAMVAWIVNAASLPILAAGTFLLTQCSLSRGSFSCSFRPFHLDMIFAIALLASAVLNWGATLLSTYALEQADASLVSPLLTFNPAFTLLIAWFALGEVPGVQQTIGVAVVLFGAYLLDVEEAQSGLLTPLRTLLRKPATVFALLASALWGTTTVLEKVAIEHISPPSGPFVALVGTTLMVLILTPGALHLSGKDTASENKNIWRGLRPHSNALAGAFLIAGIAPLFGFTAIALGLVGYVTTLFKLSSVLTILWAKWFLNEGHIKNRLLGAAVMIIGGILVAV